MLAAEPAVFDRARTFVGVFRAHAELLASDDRVGTEAAAKQSASDPATAPKAAKFLERLAAPEGDR